MAQAKTLECPKCGASLGALGNAREMKCGFCGTLVIVPAELRDDVSHLNRFVSTSFSETKPKRSGRSKAIRFVVMLGFGVFIALAGLYFLSPDVSNPLHPFLNKILYASVAMSFGSEGTAPGMFQKASRLAVDGNDNIYVADSTPRIQKFDANGKYVSLWSTEVPGVETMHADRAGNVYILMKNIIYKYEGATGKLLAKFNTDSSMTADNLRSFALYPDGGMLLQTRNEDFVRLDASGKEVARFKQIVKSQVGADVAESQLKLALDGLGNIFILNNSAHVVYKYSPAGKFISQFGSLGKDPGQFHSFTLWIAVDNQSRIYVNDTAIEVYDPTGRYLDFIPTFYNPSLLDLKITDKNEIYAVDSKSIIYKLTINK